MKKLLTICLLSFFLGQNLFAQTPHFRNYTVDDGLPSSHVYRAFQDSKGFMWFCTDKGISRFDGYKFEKFTTKNGIPNNDVWHCAEDSQQRIWFLSYANAFFYFDLKDGKFHVIANPYKQYHDNHVWCYVEEPNGMLRAILSNNLASIFIDIKNKKVVKSIYTYQEKGYNLYPVIHGKVLKNIYTGTTSSGYSIRAYSESFQHNILRKNHVLPKLDIIDNHFWPKLASLAFDDDKTIYGSNDSISYFKNNHFISTPLNKLSTYQNDKLQYILSTGDDNQKMVVTENQTFIIDENVKRNPRYNFIRNFNVNTVFFDSEKNLWLCTKNKGLFLLSQNAVNSNIYSEYISGSLTCITKDENNRIWFGTSDGKIYFISSNNQIKEQKITPVTSFPIKFISTYKQKLAITWNSPHFAIVSLKELEQNKTLVLSDFDIPNNTPIVKKNKKIIPRYIFGSKNVNFLNDNTYLLGTSGSLKIIKENANSYAIETLFTFTKVLTSKSINNQIYAGTNRGVIKVDTNAIIDKSIEALKQTNPILTKPISSFAEDNQNALWTGTDGYGVYRLHQNKVTQIPELAGIIVNHLYLEKENNRLFVSTNEGIFVLKIKPQGSNFTYNVQRISLAQGLPTLEVNAVVVRNQELFVATSKGLAVLPLRNMDDNDGKNLAMPLLIKNIKINRQDTTISQFYNLNYRQNNLDIDFVALSYKSDKNIKYEYKLIADNNTDTLWHATTDLHKEFSLLSPGKYEFMLRAFDIDGYPAKSIKPVVFVINPPFWQTLWFKILVASIIIGGIILFFYLRTLNIKKKEQEKTEVNKKFAELELQALQAQMNPHFVFNALSAIQNFILNNNTEEATDYLSRFSRLMRLFLESSRNKYIALSDEKNLLEHYIKLEELRFKDKFSSKIIVDENVSLDTEIPSMLLQPFVENAINHGLVYKENNDGLLGIHFSKNEDKLICVVEDNGIGRTKAAEIKNKSLKPYKSRSTEITEDRLRSLELIENTKIEIDILDKTDKNDKPMGTKVTIVMYL
jgi:ligand-binding sensor domain-containing protein/uncharacterized membrane-anchored protein YhcB (DUF1043 family)